MNSTKIWIRRFIFGILGLLIFLVLFVFTYSRVKDRWVLTHLPQGSQLIDIGQRKLHVRAMGLEYDGPAIVLLPGFLGNSSAWSIVQPEIARTNRVYAFDPAGFAWSEPAPTPLTPTQIADDLNAVLVKLGEKEIILVGFSGGALSVYNYYHRYPQNPRVVGLIWAEGDAMIPEELVWYNGQLPVDIPPALRPVMVEMGFWRVFAELLVGQEHERIPNAVQPLVDWDFLDKALATGGTRQTAYAAFGMVAAFPEDVKYTVAMPPSADVPVFALQADYAPDIAALKTEQEIAELHQLQEKRAEWFQMFVKNTPMGRYIPVADSSHLVVYEQPQAIVAAIKDMLDLVSK
jgi:polyhydroxybutyrate depolymerase